MNINEAIKIAQIGLSNTSGRFVTISREALYTLLENTSKSRNVTHLSTKQWNNLKILHSAHYYEEFPFSQDEMSNWYYTQEKIDWKNL